MLFCPDGLIRLSYPYPHDLVTLCHQRFLNSALEYLIFYDSFVFHSFLVDDCLKLPVQEWRRGRPSPSPDNFPSPLSDVT